MHLPPSAAPVSAVPSSRRPLAAAALLPLAVAACRLGEAPVPGDSPPHFNLNVQVLDAGDTVPSLTFGYPVPESQVRLVPAGGMVFVRGQLWPGAARGRWRRVTDGRLLVNGAELPGRIPAWQNGVEYAGEVGARTADGVVTLVLPRLAGVQPVTLRLAGVARATGTTAELSGGELRLRVVAPASGLDPQPLSARWTVTLQRGDRTTSVDGASPLTRDLILPVASILPGTGPISARLLHMVHASAYGARPAPGDSTYLFDVSMTSSVRFAPVTP